MKVLITGGNGQLGSELSRCLNRGETELGRIPKALEGAQVTAADLPELDISNQAQTMSLVLAHSPDVIINCAAYTNVDGCESDPDAAFQVNALGPRNLARAAERCGAKMIHISTDYVFDGSGTSPFDESGRCGPQSVYGATKLLGERYAREFCSRYFIVRTAWLYGYQGGNFVKTMLRLAKENPSVRVVNDQIGSPTNAADLAHHLLKLAVTEEYGIYHCTGNGACSWYEFASVFIRLAGLECQVRPCGTEEFPRPAKRPAFSVLDNRMLRCTIGDEMRDWKEAIGAYMKHYDQESGGIIV